MCLAKNNGFGDKELLIEFVYDNPPGGVTDQAISSVVKRLRDKIELDSHNPYYIRTQHGQGFMLNRWKLKS